MQEVKQFENEIVEVSVTEILEVEKRHAEPITVCVAATGCIDATIRWQKD